jgi:hypothetical protein
MQALKQVDGEVMLILDVVKSLVKKQPNGVGN